MTDRGRLFGSALAALCGLSALLGHPSRSALGQAPAGTAVEARPLTLQAGVPPKVSAVLRTVDEQGSPPPGFDGGGVFSNDGRDGNQVLPRASADGRAIRYSVWDVNRKAPGRGRGPERLVTGSDGAAYYTGDYFRTFVAIRGPRAAAPPRAAPVPATATARPAARVRPEAARLPAGAAAKVDKVLAYIEAHREPIPGYEGGRTFHNSGQDGEQALPRSDPSGRPIRYQEWDVNPKIPGRNRGAERLVTGSDGGAYYTGDHYRTFQRVR